MSGILIKSIKSIIRPADTIQYAVGDVLNAVAIVVPIELPTGYSRDAPVKLVGGQCVSSSVAGTAPAIKCMFFNDSFSIAADNAAFAPTDAQMKANFLGTLPFDAADFVDLSANRAAQKTPAQPVFLFPKPTTNNIYMVAVMANTYTPVSGEEFTFKFDWVYEF